MSSTTGSRPPVLAAADAVSGGRIAQRIAELAAGRATYIAISEVLSEEFDINVSREMVRRWVHAEGLVVEVAR